MGFLQRMLVLAETGFNSARLRLEPLQPEHAAKLLAGLQDEALYPFIPQEPPADLAWLTARFTRLAARGPADASAVWLNWALRHSDGHYCGQMEATAMDGGAVDIAYFVFRPDQRQGFAGEAVAALLAALWRDAETQVVGASLDTRNRASAALLESLGFVRMRTVEDADYFKGATSHEFRYELARQAGAQ